MSLKQLLYLFISLILASSCMKGTSADLVIHNAKVHTMCDGDEIQDAIAIKDGKIIEVGAERQILNKYSAAEYIDAGSKDVYPGFTDAHGHIFSYARQKLSVDLVGCKSYAEMLIRIEKHQDKNKRKFIIGRGWDQSVWGDNELPNNKKLNELFPDTPVCLFRIDGHALLANDFLIQQSNVYEKIKNDTELSDGGYIIYDNDEPTGVFVDNTMNPIIETLPDFPINELKKAIAEVQNELFMYGITGVHEAGISNHELKLLQEITQNKTLKLNIYAMLLPSSENISFARKNGIYHKDNLLVRSFKVYGDGAMGSRGACLKKAYTDQHNHTGYLTTSISRMKQIATICEETDYQMNTHAIGDSTNKVILDLYASIFKVKPDHRWRIEHAQVVDPNDFDLFANYGVFPSVQPTHATSDQRWAEKRLGKNRMHGAYAYKSLLERFGMLAIGTDFPVELTDPFLTIHAAVQRKNSENIPSQGFLSKESISMEECIKGMTTWAAFASFQENELGTIEKGKDATISIFERPVVSNSNYTPNFAYHVFIKGKKVYSVE